MSALSNNRILKLNREQILDRSISEPFADAEVGVDVEWRLASVEDLENLSEEQIQYNDYRKRNGRRMLEEGSLCLIGYVDNEPAHIGWISFDKIFHYPLEIPLGPGWAYFHRTRTAPVFRGKGLQAAGIRKRLEIARERGMVRAVNMVDRDNAVSLHNYRKMGFRDRETLWVFQLFGRKAIESIPTSLKSRLGSPAAP